MKQDNKRVILCAAAILIAAAVPIAASAEDNAVLTPVSDLKWTDAGVPGVSTAPVYGDMKQGESHFYLKYATGFAAPVHYHTADHIVVLVSGALTLILDGKEHRLAPGSSFSLKDKAPHAARCEAGDDCVMFVDARGPWDAVPVAQ